jgi:general secretion pathway protein G
MTCRALRLRRSHRQGFTLVELLVVVVILAILIALLVPVIMAAVRTARSAAVTAEINQLAQALAAFKEKYGEYPPSRIILCENGFYDTTNTQPLSSFASGWFSDPNLVSGRLDTGGDANILYSPTDLTYGQLAQRSIRYMRRFFPQFNLSTSGAIYNTNTGWPDFNGNFDPTGTNTGAGQTPDPPYLLQGDECLVFFLGGIPTHSPGSIGVTGFAKSPTNPFLNSSQTNNRNTPFFDFRGDRLIDDDGDGIPGYVDSLNSGTSARFYAYFASYNNGAYDPNDVNWVDPDPNTLTNLGRVFQATFSVPNGSGGTTNHVSSWAPNPYTSSEPVPTAGGTKVATYQNNNGFQIISAGADGHFGFGGRYDVNTDGSKLPLNDPANANPSSGDPSLRNVERDNLSNFASSRLDY